MSPASQIHGARSVDGGELDLFPMVLVPYSSREPTNATESVDSESVNHENSIPHFALSYVRGAVSISACRFVSMAVLQWLSKFSGFS